MTAKYPPKATFLAMLADGYDCMPEEFDAGAFAPAVFIGETATLLERGAAEPYAAETANLAPDSTVRFAHELLRVYYEEQRTARLRAWTRFASALTEGEWASLWLQHSSCLATWETCRMWERAHASEK